MENPFKARDRRGAKKKLDRLIAIPKDIPIEEHPYVIELATMWEEYEAHILDLRKKQADLKAKVDLFKKDYPRKFL